VMAFFRARGWILAAKVMPSGPFSIDNMQTDLPRRTQRTPRKAWKPSLRASVSSVVSAFPVVRWRRQR
jgi:hypothetical protein